MSSYRSNEIAGSGSTAMGVGLLLLSACGQQAGDDYRGEPLLRMRGQAVVSALTGGQAIEPALCFFFADQPDAPAFDPSTLPAEIRAELTHFGFLEVEVYQTKRVATHILDVESRGEFPAQFDVEVYLPPPSSGLSAPWVAGEPRWAQGRVCAVAAEHPPVTFPFAHGGHADTIEGHFRYAVASLQTPRFYYEAYDCPPGTLPQFATTECSKSSAGDPSLVYEFPLSEYHSESVLGTATDIDVLYLEEAAAPGSYAAWLWGAVDGLSAGYHLFPVVTDPPEGPGDRWMCLSDAFDESERMNNEVFGPRIREVFGEDFTYNSLTARNSDGSSVQELPDDIYFGAREIERRLQMEHCPIEPREELDPSTSMLSIDIRSTAGADLSPRFGSVSVGGEEQE
jgi:hypothetical protein